MLAFGVMTPQSRVFPKLYYEHRSESKPKATKCFYFSTISSFFAVHVQVKPLQHQVSLEQYSKLPARLVSGWTMPCFSDISMKLLRNSTHFHEVTGVSLLVLWKSTIVWLLWWVIKSTEQSPDKVYEKNQIVCFINVKFCFFPLCKWHFSRETLFFPSPVINKYSEY